MEKPWSEQDYKTKENIEVTIKTLEEIVEHLKRTILRIAQKYELTESKEPHNLIR